MIGKVGRFEILHRTIHSGLPYIEVVGGWHNRDGAEALMEHWFNSEYGGNYIVQWHKRTIMAAGYADEGDHGLVASAWVWENPNIDKEDVV